MINSIELSENDIKIKQRQIMELETRQLTVKLQIEQLQKAIDLDIPTKQARLQLMQYTYQLENDEDTLKKLKKQVREKKQEVTQ